MSRAVHHSIAKLPIAEPSNASPPALYPPDFKNPDYLLKLVNEQGKILPRRITGTSLKFQRRVAQAIKRARHLALMPYVADGLK